MSDSMDDLMIEVPTTKASMAEVRPALDAAIHEQFPGGMLRRQWEGDLLRLSGPGAQGEISLRGDRLVGRAGLKPPASLMRGLIEQKMAAALKKAAG